eukprot:6212854-Pleurochrysis_carterae.AAC.3
MHKQETVPDGDEGPEPTLRFLQSNEPGISEQISARWVQAATVDGSDECKRGRMSGEVVDRVKVLEGLVEDSSLGDKGGRRRVSWDRRLGKRCLEVDVSQRTQVLWQGESSQRCKLRLF